MATQCSFMMNPPKMYRFAGSGITGSIRRGTGNSVLPRDVEIPYVYRAQTSLVFFQISCKILFTRSSAKFAYFLKSMRDYHFVESSLSSDQASNEKNAKERKVRKRPQKNGKTQIYDFFCGLLRTFANFAFFCGRLGKRDARSIF